MKTAIAILLAGFFGLACGSYAQRHSDSIYKAIGVDRTQKYLAAYNIKPRDTIFQTFSPHADVVMVGDSQTHAAEWGEIFPDVRIANRGVGGDRSDDVLRRMDTVLSVNPKAAFISLGFNDISIKVPTAKIVENYKGIIATLKANGVTTYVQSTIECSRSACGALLDRVRELNTALTQFCKKEGVSFIDINSGITSKDGLDPQYTYDGIHLLGPAYVKWRDKIAPYIETVHATKT